MRVERRHPRPFSPCSVAYSGTVSQNPPGIVARSGGTRRAWMPQSRPRRTMRVERRHPRPFSPCSVACSGTVSQNPTGIVARSGGTRRAWMEAHSRNSAVHLRGRCAV